MNDISGHLYIQGNWVKGESTFESTSGPARTFSEAGAKDIDRAVKGAEEAFATYSALTRADRAAFLRRIAEEIDARGEAITEMAMAETALPEARLTGERGRTTGQLKLFADHIEKGAYLDTCHDPAMPDRTPLPRPDLRRIQRPIGPVAVFGASNFPLAFSVAGGDTASALAAGCPVVVRAHPAHPGTSELVGQAIAAAAEACGMPTGVFSLLQGIEHDVGARLVQHPDIQAVGFTGSLRGGRALFDLCAARPEPIPFYGEMGSINPLFILPNALRERAASIAEGWLNSLALGVGQFCTNPGVLFLVDSPEADSFEEAVVKAASTSAPGTMLTEGIAGNYHQCVQTLQDLDDVKVLVQSPAKGREAGVGVVSVSAETWKTHPELREEVFGPFGVIVRVSNPDELIQMARDLEGQLTCTLHLDGEDQALGSTLLPILERKAGRLLANGFPTGVDVCDAMVHGGPYPASTNFGATSVGTMAIRRFLRPVCYQDIPEALLPAELQNV